MLSDIKFFFKTIISYPTSDDEFDPKTLKIKIPVCTYITCQLCKDQYIKEHHKSCPCLKSDDKD
jgi:hypothetical protein